MIPWDEFIVASLIMALDQLISLRLTDLRPQQTDQEVPHFIEKSIGLKHHHFFDLSTKLSKIIESHMYVVQIFLGFDPYANAHLKGFSALVS